MNLRSAKYLLAFSVLVILKFKILKIENGKWKVNISKNAPNG
jgi:hypothetical protein